jgi:hypothetical protein
VPLRHVGPCEREHEDRKAARPLEQVLEELDQRGVGPLNVLDDEDHRVLLGHPLEEQAPGGEEVLPVGRDAVGEPEQVPEPGLDERTLLRVRDDLLDHRGQLAERLLGRLVLRDPRPHPDHLGGATTPARRARRRTSLARPSPPRAATTRTARQRGTGSAFPFSSCEPAVSNAMAASAARRVPSPASSAADWIRDAVLTRSAATIPCPSAPSVTAASPVRTPARARARDRAWKPSRRGRAPPGRPARRRPRSRRGAPQTAITASPMNFSTVPP